MPSAIRQLLSQTSYNTDGVTTVWDFSFAGGYIDKAHVKAYLRNPTTGLITNVPVTLGNFVGPYQLSLTPAFAIGSELTIYRDTPKDLPLVNFADKAAFTEASLDLNATQAIFVAAESSDGLATAIDSVAATAAFVAAAAASAASAFSSAATATAASSAAGASATAASLSAAAANASEIAAAASAASIAGGPVFSFNGRYGIVTLTSADVSGTGFLSNVNNTSDALKPPSNAAIAALNLKLDITSTVDSALLPVGTTAQRGAGTTVGRIRYNSTLGSFEGYSSTGWGTIGGGATGGGADKVFYLNDQVINNSFTVPAGQNAMSGGKITIADPAVVTITDGTWTIV